MLKLRHIKKHFAGIRALDNVNLEVLDGEIHAILGENGAGKSTLMKIISGAYQADAGEIYFDNKAITHNSPHKSKELGISIIYQEFSLVPDLSVTENIYLGQHATTKWINWKTLNQKAEDLLRTLGFVMNVKEKISKLSVAEQQVVEIAKALSNDIKLLILDEPSAVLGSNELEKLFALLRKLRNDGVAIIYISHHLEELINLTDRITVLKDGSTVETLETKGVTKDRLVSLMVGKSISQLYPSKNPYAFYIKSISIENLTTTASKSPLSFVINKGEILGIGGLVGSGRTEILESLFSGLNSKETQVSVGGRKIALGGPGKMIKNGWGMVPEDRKRLGGILHLSILENISLLSLKKVSNTFGFINLKEEKKVVQSLITKLKIKVGKMDNPLSSLSGGNQQKVILAKWLGLDLQVLLIDEPTRGVDVGARAEIYSIIQRLADQGMYILMVSSDIDELIGLSDRIMIIRKGDIAGELHKEQFSEEVILRMAIGAN